MTQRGLYPTLYDSTSSKGDSAFFLTYVVTPVEAKFLIPTLVSLSALVLFVFVLKKLGPIGTGGLTSALRSEKRIKWEVLLTAIAFIIVTQQVAGKFYRKAHSTFQGFPHREIVTSPYNLSRFLGFQKGIANGFKGARTWIMNLSPTLSDIEKGRQHLGLGAFDKSLASECISPWAQPLANQVDLQWWNDRFSWFQESSSWVAESYKEELPIVIQIAAESFRGDDVSGLNPKAHPRMAPFFTSLYENKHDLPYNVLAFQNLYQSGQRSSQGVSGLLCGLGNLPYSFSIVRDFENAQLRCFPRIMKDLLGQGRFFYGANPTFDGWRLFFRSQDNVVLGQTDFPKDLAKGGWGISDRALFDQSFKIMDSNVTERGQYGFVFTNTNHSPFDMPEDFPSELESDIKQIHAAKVADIDAQGEGRINTIRYTDYAIEEFVRQVAGSSWGHRAFIIIHGDHSTTDVSLWQTPSPAHVTSHIPAFVLTPAETGKMSKTVYATESYSANNIPLLLTNLLASSEIVKAKMGDGILSTLGSQLHTQEVHGVDAASRFFKLSPQGKFSLTGAKASVPTLRGEPTSDNELERFKLAALADYFQKLDRVDCSGRK